MFPGRQVSWRLADGGWAQLGSFLPKMLCSAMHMRMWTILLSTAGLSSGLFHLLLRVPRAVWLISAQVCVRACVCVTVCVCYCVCMLLCVYVCVSVTVCECYSVCMCECYCVCMYECVYGCMCLYRVSMCTWVLYICIHVHACRFMCKCIHVCRAQTLTSGIFLHHFLIFSFF